MSSILNHTAGLVALLHMESEMEHSQYICTFAVSPLNKKAGLPYTRQLGYLSHQTRGFPSHHEAGLALSCILILRHLHTFIIRES